MLPDNQANTLQCIYSSYGDDEDLGELVEMFVAEMDDRIGALGAAFEAADWEHVGRAAHQLKGAAGSYGFEELTQPAAELEVLAAELHDGQHEPDDRIKAALDRLLAMCRACRCGTPGIGR